MDVMDEFTKMENGVGTTHEVIEAYVGAKNSKGKNTTKGRRKKKAYQKAHRQAKDIDPRHVEIDGTSPNELPYIMNNGNGTSDIYKYIEYKGKRALLFKQKNVKN